MVLIPTNINTNTAKLTASNLNLGQFNLGQLKVGQVISANLVPLNNQQAQVSIGSQSFIANLKEPINLSGDVKLLVKQTSPELQLAVQTPKNTANANQLLQQSIQNVLRQFLPQQSSLNQVVQQLNNLPPLPAAINQALQQLLEQLSRPQRVNDGKQLQSAILNSGLFMESKLKPGKPAALQQDIKAQLLQLQRQTLQLNQQQPSSALSKLSDLLNQAISRITVQQVQLLENPAVSALEYMAKKEVETEPDTIEIHKKQEDEQTLWEVYINLQLEDGHLNTKLSLDDQNRSLKCYLWCDNDDLSQTVQQNLPELKQQFQRSGLKLESLQLSANPLKPKQNQTQVALIDIKV